MRRIGILTSGGDCPGLNAVLHGVVQAATRLEWEVIGFRDGYEGLLAPGNYLTLDELSTAGILGQGGTILGTTNRGHFISKAGAGTRTAIPRNIIENAKRTLRKLNIEGLICVGGDGSLATADQLYRSGVPVIGVPKTIDNDIGATAMSFGFDSAVACVADALDRLHTTAESHKRVMVTEVMGRHAGWIALYGGLAGGADIILIPEIPFDFTSITNTIRNRSAEGQQSILVVVAEGAKIRDGKQLMHVTGNGEYKLGGIGDFVAREIGRRTGKETRNCVLGHLQRGGPPTTLDRILATCYGVKAVELIDEGRFGSMVSYKNEEVGSVSISEAVDQLNLVPTDGMMVQTARAIGISFGD